MGTPRRSARATTAVSAGTRACELRKGRERGARKRVLGQLERPVLVLELAQPARRRGRRAEVDRLAMAR